MALDGVFLRHIKKEIEEKAVGCKVDKIYQPNKDEIIISFRGKTDTYKLLISSRASSPRIHFTNHKIENPKSPPMLCMLLRKKLSSSKLIGISQVNLERVLYLDFIATDELGDKVKLTLAVEIMGKYSNIILINQDEKIIDSLKRVDANTSSKRMILPGLKYDIPPPQDKISLLEHDSFEVIDLIKKRNNESPIDKAVLSCIQGLSPIVCREISYLISMNKNICFSDLEETSKKEFIKIISQLIKTIKETCGQPFMIKEKSLQLIDFSFINITQYEDCVETEKYESFSELLDNFYFKKDTQERMKAKYADLLKILLNILERISKKISIQTNEIKTSEDNEKLKVYADIINANLYKLKKGMNACILDNFYDAKSKPIEIKLDTLLSPSENAQKYYKEYKKSKTARRVLTDQIKIAETEKEYIESVLDSLSRVNTEEEIEEIRTELSLQGYLKLRKQKKSTVKKSQPLKFFSSDGLKILVGRNNSQNDYLTLKESNKNDLWFHVKDMPGSHTVLFTNGTQASETSISEAALISAFYSKASESSQVPVDYTHIRYVSKPSGSKPGRVIYKNQKTIFVKPDEKYILNLIKIKD